MDNKHAYLILAHANPGQLRKLLTLLDDARNDIFVHIDSKAPFGPGDLEGVCRNAGLYFTDRRLRVTWGGVSIMYAELELLRKATSTGHYAYYHLLSGMDLPIKSQNEIHAFFDQHQGKEFLNLWQFKSHTHRRFHYFTLFPEGSHFFLTNLLNNLVKGILIALHIRQNQGIDFRFAAQWFSITDDLARYVLSREGWLRKVFRHTSIVDEVFLATLVWNSEFRDRLYDDTQYVENVDVHSTAHMRFIDWTRGASIRHPWTFTIDDWDLLRSVPHMWARKFDERVDAQIIDKMVATLSGGNVQES